MEYYQRLKDAREDADITQKQAANLIGVQQSYYSRQERGEKPFRPEQIQILCTAFNVSADWIFGLPRNLKWPR